MKPSWNNVETISRIALTYGELSDCRQNPDLIPELMEEVKRRMIADPEYASLWEGELERLKNVISKILEIEKPEKTPRWDKFIRSLPSTDKTDVV